MEQHELDSHILDIVVSKHKVASSMKWLSILVFIVSLPVFGKEDRKFVYPDARKSEQIDDYHGTKVADPYRWLEDPDSAESRAWIEAENKVTFDFLAKIPERDRIRKRITELWDYEKFGVPFKEQDHYFISRNTGLQNQNVLYVSTNLKEKPRELLDPNTLAKDGTIALGGLAVSDDAKLMAYGLAASG
jgi:prolyl oligopeptidase